MGKKTAYYHVPNEYRQRLHFVRARYKKDIENVLLYMAHECCKISECSCEEYNNKYFNAIKAFPGNIDKSDKALNNWRTELPALFGFYIEDRTTNRTKTSKMAYFLDEHQDLTQFLKFFLLSFQFPGGHLKPNENIKLISEDVRFKPAQYFIQVLMEGNKILSAQGKKNKEMSLSAEEATYCIFDDNRVKCRKISPKEIAHLILSNRNNKIKYYNPSDPFIFNSKGKPRSSGDVKRYAGDILDLMEIAGIVEKRHGYYYLHCSDATTLSTFVNDTSFFTGYEKFYGCTDVTNEEISAVEADWFKYVSDSLNYEIFKTDVTSLLNEKKEITIIWDERVNDLLDNPERSTKNIGDVGEAIIYGHEKMRLKIAGFDELVKYVRIVDNPSTRPGYDIESREGDGTRDIRFVEVKTTISNRKMDLFVFHMSPHEWDVASTLNAHYCVYRLMLSKKDWVLYILRDPVGLYKKDKISASPRDGMEITFDENQFEKNEILVWRK